VTLKRTPKASARWYSDVARTGVLPPDHPRFSAHPRVSGAPYGPQTLGCSENLG
jgi:hypothetical protein